MSSLGWKSGGKGSPVRFEGLGIAAPGSTALLPAAVVVVFLNDIAVGAATVAGCATLDA